VSVLEKIAEGWGNGQKVKVGYRSPNSGALRERIVSPYALEPTASGVYLIGYDDWAGDIRTFKLNRLESAHLLDEPYTIPADFDAEVYLSSSWGIMTGDEIDEVELRFSAATAPDHRASLACLQQLEMTRMVAACCGSG
jgi:predicted DNA-binding transcriptional regulator YafY